MHIEPAAGKAAGKAALCPILPHTLHYFRICWMERLALDKYFPNCTSIKNLSLKTMVLWYLIIWNGLLYFRVSHGLYNANMSSESPRG